MRKFVLGAVIGLAAMGVGAGIVVIQRLAEREHVAVEASVAVPVPPPAAPAPAESAPALPALPTVDVEARPVHPVPDQLSPAPAMTVFNREGKEIRPREPPAPPSRPSVASAAAFAPASGPAVVTGATTLAIAGRQLRLFGVLAPESRDRCGIGPGDNRSCADVARDALAQRLKQNPNVACHLPAGQPGDPGAICIDATGTDLAGFLVAEGFALADTKLSYQYFGAEGVARTYREGLWRYR